MIRFTFGSYHEALDEGIKACSVQAALIEPILETLLKLSIPKYVRLDQAIILVGAASGK